MHVVALSLAAASPAPVLRPPLGRPTANRPLGITLGSLSTPSHLPATRSGRPLADDILLASSAHIQRMIFKPRRSHAPNQFLLRSNRLPADRNFRVSSRPPAGSRSSRAPGRTAGEPGNPSSAGRPPRAARHKTAPVCARRPPATSGRDRGSSTRPRRRRTTIGDSNARRACTPPTRRRDPSQPCFSIGHALSLRGRAACSAGTVASSLR